MGNHLLRLFFFTVLLINTNISWSQTADPIARLWYNSEQTAKIQIYKAEDGKFYGKVVWLKVPLLDGKPKVDMNNPVKNRKNDPINGLLILKGFKKHGENTYEDGTIYDPKNGKTYSCSITHSCNTLDVRGYVGFSLFGRTTKWTLAE